MQTIFNCIKCREITLPHATGSWYIILYDLVLRRWYIATCGPFCNNNNNNNNMYLKSSIQTSSIDYIKENIHITLNISSNIPIQ